MISEAEIIVLDCHKIDIIVTLVMVTMGGRSKADSLVKEHFAGLFEVWFQIVTVCQLVLVLVNTSMLRNFCRTLRGWNKQLIVVCRFYYYVLGARRGQISG